MDDGIAVLREWALLNPSPRSFLSNCLFEDLGCKPISDFSLETLHAMPLHEKNYSVSEDYVEKNGWHEVGNASSARSNELGVGKRSSRGGLGERIAARAGFDAPKLNTARIKSGNFSSSTSGLPSPYVTIPPGLSPTTLLESPIFLLNSLQTQPSPTTGKFLQGQYTGYGSISAQGITAKDVLIDDIDSDFFTFKPALGTSESYSHDAINQQLPMHQQHQNQAGINDVDARSPSDDVLPDTEEQKMEISSVSLSQPADDGYNWRKYGQKQVKGSDFPRGYYKCTHPNCPSKKKIERSQEGHITDVIYKGVHNHPKPPPNRRTILLASHLQQIDCIENPAPAQLTMLSEATGGSDGTEASSYVPMVQSIPCFESSNTVHLSSALSLEDEETDQANRGSGSIDEDIDENEFESKRRRLDTSLVDLNPSSRTSREPRIVVQTTSEVDILDDGYRWRKYGQKVVKGNPNPRSYYKCTSAGCNVRKHVERASHDLKSVITTYEGRHNHDVPVARSGSSSSHATSAHSNIHSHSFSRLTNPRFNAQPSLPASFSREGRSVEPPPGFCLGLLGQVGLRKNLPQLQMNQGFRGGTGFMVPRGEAKSEQAVATVPNAMTLYQQILGRLPLGS